MVIAEGGISAVEPDGRSPVTLVRQAIGPLLTGAAEQMERAEAGVVMLAAVPGSGVTQVQVAALAEALETVRRLLDSVGPAPHAGVPRAHPPVARGELGLRDAIRLVIAEQEGEFFTPRGIFNALGVMAGFDRTPYPDLHKAVQNALADMARTGEIQKQGRGRYLSATATMHAGGTTGDGSLSPLVQRRQTPRAQDRPRNPAAVSGSGTPLIDQEDAHASEEPPDALPTQPSG